MKTLIGLTLLIALAGPLWAADDVKVVSSKITDVTVFADRAQVTRTAVGVPLGGRLAFERLPGWIDEGSVRVSLNRWYYPTSGKNREQWSQLDVAIEFYRRVPLRDAKNPDAVFGIGNAYYPADQNQLVKTYQRWISQIAQDGLGNLFKEFWPDVNKALFHQKY